MPATWRMRLAHARDGQVAWALAVLLFCLSAWPLALVDIPPLQDLPNHLAAASIIEHPAQYPELCFNGLLKTNSALFAWLLLVGRVVGIRAAGKCFVVLVLALGAVALPRFVLQLGGRRRMLVSSLFAWPMVHNWFVASGMLDFALAVPLAALTLVELDRQGRHPSLGRSVGIALLGAAGWYAHAFPLLVVHLLVVVHAATRRSWPERWSQARALLVPLAPSTLLVAWSLWLHVTEPAGAMTADVALGRMLPLWELVYNLWAEWFWSFTWLEIATLVPCVLLAGLAIARWREDVRRPDRREGADANADVSFFGPVALACLSALYFFSPYVATNWFHVNSRIIPFLWLGALVRLPERLPRWLCAALAASALVATAGLGLDYVRLARDWDRLAAGTSAVPRGAKLLPMIFRSKGTSQNTRSLLHVWGLYVTERQTSAPLLFSHSRSFPLSYREPPPPQFNHLVLEAFAPSMGTPEWMCTTLRTGGVAIEDCEGEWRARWAEFWRQAEPRYDHVLMWSAPAPILAMVPGDYRVTFQRGDLTILERSW
jgi:hypothetical protein